MDVARTLLPTSSARISAPPLARPASRRQVLRLLGLGALAAGGLPLLAACSSPVATTSSPTSAPAPASAATSAAPAGNAAPATGGAASTLKVGYLPITDAAPLVMAHARDFYTANGLKPDAPTLFRSWAQIAEAFQAGQVDVAHLLMPSVVQLRFASKFPVKLVAWDHINGSALTVAPSINKVDDLAGTTVAIPFWYSIHNIVLQQLFQKAGIKSLINGDPSVTDKTVKLVVMAPPDMPAALGQGSIKGYIVAEPFNAVAENGNVGKILRFTGDVWRDHACCVVVMNEQAVQQRPDFVQAVITSIAQAQNAIRSDPAGASQILGQEGKNYLPQPAKVIELALDHYSIADYGPSGAIQHPEWNSRRTDYQPFPFPTYTQRMVELMKSTVMDGDLSFLNTLDPAQVHGQLVEDKFVREAIKAVGGTGTFNLPDSLSRTETIAV